MEGMRFHLSLLLIFLACSNSPAMDYASLVMEKSPAIHLSFSPGDTTGELTSTVKQTRMLAPLRGINGLAGTYSRSSLGGNTTVELSAEQNQELTAILNNSFSLELWFLDNAPAPDNNTNYSILYKADPASFTGNSLWIYRKRQDGHILFTIQDKQKNLIRLEIKNPALSRPQSERIYHHLAVTVKRNSGVGKATAFLDGQQVAQQTFTQPVEILNAGNLILGNNHATNSPWEGRLDELAIYNRPLTSAEIASHYKAGLATLTPAATRNPSLAEKETFFETQIRPILVERCADCHSGETGAESEFSVLSRNSILRGGNYGAAVVPFRAEDSLLIAAIQKTHKELRMPPDDDDQLTRDQIRLFYQWINDGAIWPGSNEDESAAGHDTQSKSLSFAPELDWALLPRRITTPPPADDDRWNNNPIDQFLQAQRVLHDVRANDRADRRTLIRRATLDLTGLPPTIEQVNSFLEDQADDQTAFARVIDSLTDSPRYGERQGRLWLDVARYADTQGDVGDIPIHSAYLYRNWVINSLNKDMPYNLFLQAQLAGDILALRTSDEEEAKGYNVATGFISLSRRFGNRKADSLHLTIEDTLDTVGRGIMGLTLRCARCHDHKFDPIPTEDYYGLYGIFNSTVYPWMGMSDEKSPLNLNPHNPLDSSPEKASEYWELIARYEYQLNNHFRPWLKPTLEAFKQTDSQLTAQKTKLQTLADDQRADSDEAAAIRKTITRLEQEREQHLAFRSGKFRELMLQGLDWIRKEKDRLGKEPPYDFVFSVREGAAADSPVHLRGNPENKGEVVPRDFLSTITPVKEVNIKHGSGRLEFANWITLDDHPLTARVVVNRIWAQHFGRGLVETLDNFGRQGKRPSHPELLDWLAETFVRDNWSLKRLHRRIMLTQTYQLSSLDSEEAIQTKDPGNVWLWRYSRQRLDAESIRDSILYTSGLLDLTQPGAHPLDPWFETRYNLNNPFHKEYDHNHRSVYLITQRIFRHSLLGLFDSPDTNSSTSTRNSTTVPAQALFLMNSKFISDQAHALAVRMAKASEDETQRIQWIYQHLFARVITTEELHEIREFLAAYRNAPVTAPISSAAAPTEYQALCRVLITSNEFFFID